jgi:hypothetical protein
MAAGSRGSEREMSSHPATCAASARAINHPWLSRPGFHSSSDVTIPYSIAASVDARVAWNNGPATRRRSRDPSRITRMKIAYAIEVPTPKTTPRAGSSP